jgi:hypothetical protein
MNLHDSYLKIYYVTFRHVGYESSGFKIFITMLLDRILWIFRIHISKISLWYFWTINIESIFFKNSIIVLINYLYILQGCITPLNSSGIHGEQNFGFLSSSKIYLIVHPSYKYWILQEFMENKIWFLVLHELYNKSLSIYNPSRM